LGRIGGRIYTTPCESRFGTNGFSKAGEYLELSHRRSAAPISRDAIANISEELANEEQAKLANHRFGRFETGEKWNPSVNRQ
jgi:hypothetical protein